MLSCRELVARSSALIDGELGWRERLQMRLHMALCRRCRGFVDALGNLGRSLDINPDIDREIYPDGTIAEQPQRHSPDDEAAVERIAARMAAQARAAGASGDAAVPHSAGQDRGRTPDPDDDAPADGR